MSPKRIDDVWVTVPPSAAYSRAAQLERLGEPRPADGRQHLVTELLGIEPGLDEADQPERALPGVLPRRVVQEDQATGRVGLVEVLAGRPGGVGLDAERPRVGGQAGRSVECGHEELRPRPDAAQRSDGLPELERWGGRIGHERGL